MGDLTLVPVSLRDANGYVKTHHRHHKAVQGHKFAVAASQAVAGIVGVAIVGRPVAKALNDGFTAEITRLCTNGARNACSFLAGAARRAAASMGYRRVITYTLLTESGVSLRAAGFRQIGVTRGGSWSRPSRRRVDKAPITPKRVWCWP